MREEQKPADVAVPDVEMRAQAAPRIQRPYTLAEIKAKIASNDYSAELLLQHAMLLLEGEAAPAAVAGPSEVQELRAIAAFLGGAKDRLGRPDAAANDEMRTARETIRAAAVRRGVAGGHHTYIDQCAAVLAALANKIGGVA